MADITTVAQAYDNAGAEITAARASANNYKINSTYGGYGTPALGFYKVVLSGGSTPNMYTNFGNSGSNFQKAVNALQGFAELYFLGVPATGDSGVSFVFAINENTGSDGTAATPSVSTADNWGKAEAAILAALGSWGSGAVTISALTASGATIA